MLSRLHIGCSGWSYKHWKEKFYPSDLPQQNWFQFYSKVFDTVELNNTFYRLPPAKTFEVWKRQAPKGFIYAVKANRFLTHLKKLKDSRIPLQRFLKRTRLLNDHLGPILYQLPPRWSLNFERLRSFLDLLPRDLDHVIEFREPSWFRDEVFALLNSHQVSFCCHDLSSLSVPRVATGHLAYVRFHGGKLKYQGSYPVEALSSWEPWLKGQLAGNKQAYVYFNNDANAHAVENAKVLKQRLSTGAAKKGRSSQTIII